MDVLHLDSGREMRGGQWQALYLMVGQKTLGLTPSLLAPAKSPLFQEASKRGVPCLPLNLLTLRKMSAKVSITHAHDARSHTMAALMLKSPFVVSRRVAFPIGKGWASRWKYSKPRCYFAVSKFVADLLIQAGVEEERIALMPDGVPIEDIPPTIGNRLITPYWDDPRKETQLAEEAAIAAGVPMHISSNLKDDLPTARVLLYLSDMEGLGSAALFAMAAGVPVIASRVGGLPEIVHDGVTGLLVNNEVSEVSAAIRRLMTDERLAQRLGRNGREMVKEGYTLAHMALRTIKEYKRLLK